MIDRNLQPHPLAMLEMHCPACDRIGVHLLLKPAAPLLTARASARRSWLLACSDCGASQCLTGEQKDHALNYLTANR